AAIPDTVHYAFYLGAAALFFAVAWTVLRSREYPPEALAAFARDDVPPASRRAPASGGRARAFNDGLFATILNDLVAMPTTMRRLIPVQFFSWLALFAMWIYTTAAVTQVHFGSTDPQSELYNQGANWVGVLFGAYNGFAALAAAAIPLLARRIGM